MTRSLERIPTQLVRYSWYVEYPDGSGEGGWTATRAGARRAIERAEAQHARLVDVEARGIADDRHCR